MVKRPAVRARKSKPAKPAGSAKSTKAGLIGQFPWARIALSAVVLGLAALLLYRYVDIEAVHARAAGLNAGVAFALLTVLPLLGFPASLLHVAAGIRFGVGLGLALVALSILLQLLASYGIVHLWRDRFNDARWIKRVRTRLPEGAHASVCVLAVLLPGAPFAAINYVLPLIGVPLRTYLMCALPLHAFRSTITVAFGDQSDQLTPGRLAVLLVYAAMILGASAWTYRRLRLRLEGRPSVAGGRTQPA